MPSLIFTPIPHSHFDVNIQNKLDVNNIPVVPRENVLHWQLVLGLYIEKRTLETTTIPVHKRTVSFEIPGVVPQTQFLQRNIRFQYKGSTVRDLIIADHGELVIYATFDMPLTNNIQTKPMPMGGVIFPNTNSVIGAYVKLELIPAGTDFPIPIEPVLLPYLRTSNRFYIKEEN